MNTHTNRPNFNHRGSFVLRRFRRHLKMPVTTLTVALFAMWNLQVRGETWVPTTAGPFIWTTAANWSPATVPNAIDAVAILRSNLTANQTISLATGAAANVTVGTLSIGDTLGTSTMTINAGVAGSSLVFDVAAGNANLNKYNSTTDVIQAPMILNDNLNANIYSGTLDVNGAANVQVSYSGTGDTIKNGAGAPIEH